MCYTAPKFSEMIYKYKKEKFKREKVKEKKSIINMREMMRRSKSQNRCEIYFSFSRKFKNTCFQKSDVKH